MKLLGKSLFVSAGMCLVVFSFAPRAQAIDVSGLGSAIVGCSHLGDAFTDMVTELGKKDSSSISFESEMPAITGGGLNLTDGVLVMSPTLQKTLDKQKKIAQQQQNKTDCLDAMGRAAANIALTNITQKTVNWANTGLKGNPLYVRDYKSYFSDLKTKELQVFLNDLSSANNAFGAAIAKDLIANEQNKQNAKSKLKTNQREKTGYTSQEFEGDFDKGGWGGFLNYNLNSANNPLGSRFVAQQLLDQKQSDATNAAQNELIWNNGFLSIKKCADAKGTITSGYAGNAPCKTFETQTPGVIIQNQLSKALNVPIDKLENVQYFNDALGGLLDGLMNNLFNKGLAAIFKDQNTLGNNSSGFLQSDVYGGANISLLGDQNFNPDSLYSYGTSWFGLNGDFDIRSKTQFNAVINTQKNYINAMEESKPLLDKIILPIANLDMCYPGPNPVWAQETGYKLQVFSSSLLSSTYGGNAPGQLTGVKLPWLIDPKNGAPALAVNIMTQGKAQTLQNIAVGLIHTFGGQTAEEKTVAQNEQNAANYQALSQEYTTNQYRLIQGLQIAYQEYYDKVNSIYKSPVDIATYFAQNPNSNSSRTEAGNLLEGILPIVSSLRNYDNNISALKEVYEQRKQDTQLNVARLQLLWSKMGPVVARAKARADVWNLNNCPLPVGSTTTKVPDLSGTTGGPKGDPRI